MSHIWHVMFDMDGVIADLEGRVREILYLDYPRVRVPRFEDRKTFYIDDEMEPHNRHLVAKIIASEGFFLSLKPIPGSVEAIKQIASLDNVHVSICTSPLRDPRYCVGEKYEWVRTVLGESFAENIIMIRDKTKIGADFLVDDKPFISGKNPQPSWKHIVRRQPYNANCGKEFVDWSAYEGWKWFYEYLMFE